MKSIDETLESYNPPSPDLVDYLTILLRVVAASAAIQSQPNVEELIENDPNVQARFRALSRHLKDTLNVEPALIEYARHENEERTRIISKDGNNSRGWPIFRRIT